MTRKVIDKNGNIELFHGVQIEAYVRASGKRWEWVCHANECVIRNTEDGGDYPGFSTKEEALKNLKETVFDLLGVTLDI